MMYDVLLAEGDALGAFVMLENLSLTFAVVAPKKPLHSHFFSWARARADKGVSL